MATGASHETLQRMISLQEASGDASDMPVLFISHGAGPCFFIDGYSDIGRGSATAQFLQTVGQTVPQPKAILCVSAHWESKEQHIKVSSNPKPPMIFDYGGFPEHTYELDYPASGDADLSHRVSTLLNDGGIPCVEDPDYGFDHGAFIPLLLMYPDANIPVVQLSIHGSYDGPLHHKLGALLQPLRKDGVLIMGSGSCSHSTRDPSKVEPWHEWITETLCDVPHTDRTQRLEGYREESICSAAHPRPDHFMPVHVAVGAAGEDKGAKIHMRMAGLDLSSYIFSSLVDST